MSSQLQQEFVRVISDALHEINEMFGYEVIDSSEIDKIAANSLKVLPTVEDLLKSKRGVTLEDVEKEEHNYEKAKAVVIRRILHEYIFKGYKGTSFEEKFKDYLYSSGTETCEWIGKTGYDSCSSSHNLRSCLVGTRPNKHVHCRIHFYGRHSKHTSVLTPCLTEAPSLQTAKH
jgi:hypothetical protein